MASKSKWFKVCAEGGTADGRTIKRNWIEESAKSYNPQKYSARVWMEHYRSVMPEGPFGAYGDVIALKAQEDTIDGEKRLVLYAQISPTNELIALNAKRQKIFTSAEFDPNFAESGQCYLVGLAVTDSPASLCTEALQFTLSRKQKQENVFTAGQEVQLEFDDDENAIKRVGDAILSKVRTLLGKQTTTHNENLSGITEAVETVAESQGELLTRFSQLEKAQSDLTRELKDTQTAFTDLKQKLSVSPEPGDSRPVATGGTTLQQTDC